MIGARAIAPVTERMPASPCCLVMNVGDNASVGQPCQRKSTSFVVAPSGMSLARNENLG